MIGAINSRYSVLEQFDTHSEYGDKSYSLGSSVVKKRHKAWQRTITQNDKLKAGVGATTGTVLSASYLMKKQKIKNPFNIKYGLAEMIFASALSIAGGVGIGMLGEDKKTQQNKLREGLFQFFNASLPAWVVAGALKLSETSRNFNNAYGKIISSVTGLVVGMYGAASLANVISDPNDKFPDRKLTLKDCFANIDDAIGVLILSKFPLADKLKIEKLLPFVYSYCGYRAGKSN